MREISCAFIAAGGNRHPSAADVESKSGLVAFGAGRNIALWNPKDSKGGRGIETLLNGHTDVVNAVKFFALNDNQGQFLLSGSADTTIRLWRKSLDESGRAAPDALSPKFNCLKTLHGHERPVNAIAVLTDHQLFVSGAANSELKVWKCHLADGDDMQVDLIQTIILTPRCFPLCLALSVIPASEAIVLAAAGSRTTVQIFVSHQHGTAFEKGATLSGHEGWIRSLDFCAEAKESGDRDNDLLLASASQDKYIRLWRFHKGEALPAAVKATNDPLLGEMGASLSNKAHRFETGGSKYSITFEALLVGHEDWIYNARWCSENQGLQLLSASADNSLAIWEADVGSGVWTCTVRLGEISAQKGATTATGSTGGFWIGHWLDAGRSVLSLGRTGGWRIWHYDAAEDMWTQVPAVGGHTREVTGLAWAKDGSYLLSTSSDQTTRMFAPTNDVGASSWHELSRPQIHGYDLNCIDVISGTSFVSGADEKLLRVFDEPKAVAELLSVVCGIVPAADTPMPEAANIPVLGLSNKIINQDTNGETIENEDAHESEKTLSGETHVAQFGGLPLEDHLSRHLLWPESEKLYGHGYEISAVAASNDGSVVATACRASSIDHAVIRLFGTADWREVKPNLTAHSLTVTRLQFSPDDAFLLSVGRDRQCAVFARGAAEPSSYVKSVSDPKAHTRMLLDASWAPLDAGRVFATAGRDKTVHIWRLLGNELSKETSIAASAPVTAVAFLPRLCSGKVILAYGLEDGTIFVGNVDKDNLSLGVRQSALSKDVVPSQTVTQLSWRPRPHTEELEDATIPQLAIASEDGSVRILNLDIEAMLGL